MMRPLELRALDITKDKFGQEFGRCAISAGIRQANSMRFPKLTQSRRKGDKELFRPAWAANMVSPPESSCQRAAGRILSARRRFLASS